uniref:Reverse transcriptase RNase H-like domain-containing protein n=1 Tax=Pundamilia nyererei TaxID=303518 RepID=A0A3B4HCN0_9CICH
MGAFCIILVTLSTFPRLPSVGQSVALNDKPFYLHVDGGTGFMKAVLTQAFGEKQRPLAFYSCKLDSVASGLPTCVQACWHVLPSIACNVIMMDRFYE